MQVLNVSGVQVVLFSGDCSEILRVSLRVLGGIFSSMPGKPEMYNVVGDSVTFR